MLSPEGEMSIICSGAGVNDVLCPGPHGRNSSLCQGWAWCRDWESVIVPHSNWGCQQLIFPLSQDEADLCCGCNGLHRNCEVACRDIQVPHHALCWRLLLRTCPILKVFSGVRAFSSWGNWTLTLPLQNGPNTTPSDSCCKLKHKELGFKAQQEIREVHS